MNVIARLGFELVYYDSAVQHFKHYARYSTLFIVWFGFKERSWAKMSNRLFTIRLTWATNLRRGKKLTSCHPIPGGGIWINTYNYLLPSLTGCLAWPVSYVSKPLSVSSILTGRSILLFSRQTRLSFLSDC